MKAFFSEWLKDQLTRILPGSKEATDLFNLQLLDDMLSTYDPGHCVIGESHVLDAAISGFPARILEVFTSNKSMFMAATMVHCKAVLARFSADFLSAPAWPHVRPTSEQDPLERILPDCTIQQHFTSSLQALQTIRSDRWSEISDDFGKNWRLFRQVAYQQEFVERSDKRKTDSMFKQPSENPASASTIDTISTPQIKRKNKLWGRALKR